MVGADKKKGKRKRAVAASPGAKKDGDEKAESKTRSAKPFRTFEQLLHLEVRRVPFVLPTFLSSCYTSNSPAWM